MCAEFWQGRLVTMLADGSWSFHRCVVCERFLGGGESAGRGVGSDCLSWITPEQLKDLLAAALEHDTARFVREHPRRPT